MSSMSPKLIIIPFGHPSLIKLNPMILKSDRRHKVRLTGSIPETMEERFSAGEGARVGAGVVKLKTRHSRIVTSSSDVEQPALLLSGVASKAALQFLQIAEIKYRHIVKNF